MRALLTVGFVLLLSAGCSSSHDDGDSASADDAGTDEGGSEETGSGGLGAPFGPFTLRCGPGEARFAGTVDGHDYTFTGVTGGDSGVAELRAEAAYQSDSDNIDIYVLAEPPNPDFLSEEVVPARVWIKMHDDLEWANCATDGPDGEYAYVGYGPRRFLTTRLHVSDSNEPCSYDVENGLQCLALEEACAGDTVEGTLEMCYWHQG